MVKRNSVSLLFCHTTYIAARVGFGPVQSSRCEDTTAINKKKINSPPLALRPDTVHGLLIHKVSRSHTDTPQ